MYQRNGYLHFVSISIGTVYPYTNNVLQVIIIHARTWLHDMDSGTERQYGDNGSGREMVRVPLDGAKTAQAEINELSA